MSTELSTSVIARIGPVISFIALMVASRTGRPLSSQRLDVLQHDDGVVHDDADGQHQPEQGQVIQAEPQQAHDGERPDQETPDVDHGQEQGFPVLQEQQDDEATRMIASRKRLAPHTDSRMKGVVSYTMAYLRPFGKRASSSCA